MTKDKQTIREELIKELKFRMLFLTSEYEAEFIADFILKDRERVVEPLIRLSKSFSPRWNYESVRAIQETLKLAGIDTDK